MKPSYAIGSVPSLSGHAIAYRWRSLPRVRRHRASMLPWQITMDQSIFASLSHTHYWYEVGINKQPTDEPYALMFSVKCPAVHDGLETPLKANHTCMRDFTLLLVPRGVNFGTTSKYSYDFSLYLRDKFIV